MGPGQGGGGGAAAALGPGRPRGAGGFLPRRCERRVTDPRLAVTGPSPTCGHGARCGRSGQRAVWPKLGRGGVDTGVRDGCKQSEVRLPMARWEHTGPRGWEPGQGWLGGASRADPAPCSLRLGRAPVPPVEGRAFFPFSSPLRPATCHDPVTCHSPAGWQSGQRTALPESTVTRAPAGIRLQRVPDAWG